MIPTCSGITIAKDRTMKTIISRWRGITRKGSPVHTRNPGCADHDLPSSVTYSFTSARCKEASVSWLYKYSKIKSQNSQNSWAKSKISLDLTVKLYVSYRNQNDVILCSERKDAFTGGTELETDGRKYDQLMFDQMQRNSFQHMHSQTKRIVSLSLSLPFHKS